MNNQEEDGAMALVRLIELASQLPPNLRSDWKGTNHFELQAPMSDDYFWLCLSDFFDKSVWEYKDFLERVGLLMDIAEALKQAEPILQKIQSMYDALKWMADAEVCDCGFPCDCIDGIQYIKKARDVINIINKEPIHE